MGFDKFGGEIYLGDFLSVFAGKQYFSNFDSFFFGKITMSFGNFFLLATEAFVAMNQKQRNFFTGLAIYGRALCVCAS